MGIDFVHDGVGTFYRVADIDAHDGFLANALSSNLMPISLKVRITISAAAISFAVSSLFSQDQSTLRLPSLPQPFAFFAALQRFGSHIGMGNAMDMRLLRAIIRAICSLPH